MKRTLAALALLGCLALTGCGWQGSGVIAEKTHSDSFIYYTTQCGYFDAKGNCSYWAQIPQIMPESWGYVVRDSDGNTHDVAASSGDWNGHKVGDHFDNRDTK